MEFRILGPLEVLAGGQGLDLGGQKQRAVLAALLLEPNRVVATSRLIDAVWEDEPPETAAKAVQVYISQLRKQLGSDRLVTKSPGYLVRVEDGELDLDRARRLAEDGAYDAALAHWRGAPLSDLAPLRFAEAAASGLDELRLSCLEQRFERRLAEGRPLSLVGELEALVADHPLREELRAQLMIALYRSGRQAEALATYQDARRALVEELGLEPSRRLQDLEQAILRHDSMLEVQGSAGGHAAELVYAPESSSAPASEPMAERKLATVLFVDLVGSTELGEQDPERTRALLERYYDAVAAEIESAGGTLEKFAGDAVVATFGAPAAQEDHVERALHAALAVRGRCGELFGAALELHF